MKYLEVPKRIPRSNFPPNRKHPHDRWIRLLLALGTILVLYFISQFFKAERL